jgi:hypothetical protein
MEIRIAMRLTMAMSVVACSTSAGEPSEQAWYRVNVHMSTKQGVSLRAGLLWDSQATASAIFTKIGIQLTWRTSRQRPAPKDLAEGAGVLPTRELAIEVVPRAPDDLSDYALAMAIPYADSRVRIVIFYDRMESMLKGQCAPQAVILGYVLADEIGHVLQGIARHSETGIMRARWTKDDFTRMSTVGLTFTTEDIQLIRQAVPVVHASSDLPKTKL